MNRSLWILFSVVALDLVGFGIVMPILPFYAQEYGANGKILGLILTAYSAMQFLFAPLWGRYSDRVGRRRVLLLTMSGSVVSLLVLGFASSLTLIFVGRILSGIFAANVGVASAYVGDVTTEKDRTSGMGLIGAAFGVGFLIGPALGGIFSRWGYNVPILVAAAISALNLAYASRWLEEPERHEKFPDLPRVKALGNRSVFKVSLLSFLMTLSFTQLEAIFAFFAKDRYQMDANHVAYLLALMALVMVIVQGGLIRPLSTRFREKFLLMVGVLLISASFLSIPLVAGVGLLTASLCLASLGRGIGQPSLMGLASKVGGEASQGAVMGAFQSAASLGRVVGPVIAGILYDQWQGAPFFLAGGVALSIFFLLISE